MKTDMMTYGQNAAAVLAGRLDERWAPGAVIQYVADVLLRIHPSVHRECAIAVAQQVLCQLTS